MRAPSHHFLIVTAFVGSVLVLFSPESPAAAGDLYQSDPSHGAINRYTPGNGTPTIFVNGITGLTSRIAFNRAGDLFVGDANGILKISPAGVKSTFATGVKVNGIRCDAAGNVFVSDGTSRSILKISPAGVKSTFAPAVIDTLDLVFDTNGDLLAVDYGADPSNPNGPGINGQGKIYRFKPDGTRTVGSSPGPANRPTCIAIDGKGSSYYGSSDGTIYHASFSYDPDFSFGGTTLFTGGLGNIPSMACDPAGNLFVSTPSGIIKFNYQAGSSSKSTFSSVGTSAGIAFEPPRALALNIATRLAVQGGENVLIGGFIITETGGKSVVIRGIGPSLASVGVQGALQDPVIEVHYPSGFVVTNDNWKDTQASQIQGTGLAPTDDREAAFSYNLPPGNYTIVLKGKNNSAGIGLIEVYDIDRSSGKLANISTRGFVGSGDNVMIGGFILGGVNGAARIMIRAIGPSLSAFGVSNPLENPTVTLRDGNGTTLNSNNDWLDDNATEIYLTGLGPSNRAESAIVMTLPNGNYTAVVAGLNGGTGIGLVEAYNLD
jgi:sugar lactone lactonase YvrE